MRRCTCHTWLTGMFHPSGPYSQLVLMCGGATPFSHFASVVRRRQGTYRKSTDTRAQIEACESDSSSQSSLKNGTQQPVNTWRQDSCHFTVHAAVDGDMSVRQLFPRTIAVLRALGWTLIIDVRRDVRYTRVFPDCRVNVMNKKQAYILLHVFALKSAS